MFCCLLAQHKHKQYKHWCFFQYANVWSIQLKCTCVDDNIPGWDDMEKKMEVNFRNGLNSNLPEDCGRQHPPIPEVPIGWEGHIIIKVTSPGITLVSKTIVIRRSSTAPWMVPLFPLTSPCHTRAATHHRLSCSRLSPTRVVPLMLTRFDIKKNELKFTNSLCLFSLIICFAMEKWRISQ